MNIPFWLVQRMRRTKQQKIFYYTAPAIYRKKIAELETAEERICWLFSNNEHLRNCTKCLIFHYWHYADGFNGGKIDIATVHSLTPAETITRAARHIQNDLGLWLPTDPSQIEARKISQDAVLEWAINKKRVSSYNAEKEQIAQAYGGEESY